MGRTSLQRGETPAHLRGRQERAQYDRVIPAHSPSEVPVACFLRPPTRRRENVANDSLFSEAMECETAYSGLYDLREIRDQQAQPDCRHVILLTDERPVRISRRDGRGAR